MRLFLHLSFGAALIVWTLIALLGWILVSLGGDLAHSTLDDLFMGDSNLTPVAGSVLRFFQSLGLGLIVVVWTIGAIAIWFVSWLIKKLSTAEVFVAQGHFEQAWRPRAEPNPATMRDVTPARPPDRLPPR